ncbi:hypothetical protein JCM16303_004764 [Sporobolomyces ruberrimus]
MTTTIFFYGTLCVPAVLERVIGRSTKDLVTKDATLKDHARLQVKGEDYPALVTLREAERIEGFELERFKDVQVQGVVVEGLTEDDLQTLDVFEGDEYTRGGCTPMNLQDPSKTYPNSIYYHYTAPVTNLSPQPWTLSDFLRDASHRWIGAGGEGEYSDVDRLRRKEETKSSSPPRVREAESEAIEQVTGPKEEGKEYRAITGEAFGKELREKYWSFEKGWVNLNHGSYGAAPKPVVDSFLSIRSETDSAPDRFMRLSYESRLVSLRSRLAEFVDCDTEDLVVVPNATMGVNTALHSMANEWQKGDKLLYFDTSIYYACKLSLQHIVDTHPHLSLSLLPITFTYPISHSEVIEKTRKAIEEAEAGGECKVRLALIDGISSNPGVVVPWEKLVDLFREKGVVSLVDAAHNIGQLPVSLRETKPDFWISNCHKWLLAHRGCAVLHVNKRLQHLVHSIPISHFYAVRPKENASKWVDEFIWTGTPDWSPILSTLAALDFRRDVLGGEERIRNHCHDLAIRGGERVAEILGTKTMRNEREEEEGELVANMINVLLPLPSQTPFGTGPPLEGDRLKSFWWNTLIEKYKTAVPIFPHAGLPWVRLSAQVYTDLDDFEYVGKVLKEVCEAIERGEHLRDEKGENGITGAEEDE